MKKKYKSGLLITSLVVVACVLISSYVVVGCGQKPINRYGYGGYGGGYGAGYGPLGGAYPGGQVYQATGYHSGGHLMNLTLSPHGNYNYPQAFSPIFLKSISWSGPVDIRAELLLAYDLGNTYLFNGMYGGFQYQSGYHPGALRPFNNCVIPAGRYNVFVEYPATMHGTSFGNYQLVAQGPGGVVLLMTPINPSVEASFIAGYNLGNPYVYMDLIVERADQYAPGVSGGYQIHNLRYCSRHRITFGSP